jgi:hypothetical protein
MPSNQYTQKSFSMIFATSLVVAMRPYGAFRKLRKTKKRQRGFRGIGYFFVERSLARRATPLFAE